MRICVKKRGTIIALVAMVILAALAITLTSNTIFSVKAYPGTKTVASYTNGEFFTKANDSVSTNNSIDPVGVDADGQALFVQTQKSLAIMASNFMKTLPLKESYYATRFVFDAFIKSDNAAVISIGTESVWALGGATPGVTFMISHNAVYGYIGNNNGDYLNAANKISEGANGGVRENDYNKITLIIDGSGNASIDVNGIPATKTINAQDQMTSNFCAFGMYGTDLKIKNLTISTQGKNYSYFGSGNQSDTPYNGVVVEKEIEPLTDPTVAPSGTTYYISSTGNDDNSGTTQNSPFKSLNSLINIKLSPNDKVLLKRGDSWKNERLTLAGSGSPSYPIVVSAYGDSKLPKPIIALSQGEDDIAVVINDFVKEKNGNFSLAPIQFYEISQLDIRDTRLGIYVRSVAGRETPKHSKNRNSNIIIKDCDFNNIVCPDLMNYLNDKTQDRPTLAARVGEKLHQFKGNLAWSDGSNYIEPGEANNKSGKQEYIFPAAIFIGGYKMVPSKGLAPCMQNIRVLNCDISEASAGIMMWMYFNYGGAQANTNVYKNVNIENVNMTGVINGGFAFDGVNGGAKDAVNNKVEPNIGTSATDNGVRWGLIENTRIISGTDEAYNTFINGTTGAIFNNTSQFLIKNSEFAGVTNQGNNDGCGFDFETYCKNVEIRSTTFHDNEAGAILIMDSQEQYGVKGPHTNLFFNGNYFYNNNISQKEEYRTINIYSKLHKNIQFNNNVFVMPTKSNINKAIVLGKPAQGVVVNDDLADPDTFTSTNNIYYFGTKVQGNESYESIESPTEFDLIFSGGTATVNGTIDLNVYKMLQIDLLGNKNLDGTIILENLLGEKFEKQFSTVNGNIDLVSLFGSDGEPLHTPIKSLTIKMPKAGSAIGKLKFTLNTKMKIDFMAANKAIITSTETLPFSGENKDNFTVKFDSVVKEIQSVKKIGINKMEITFTDNVYSEGTDLTAKDVEITVAAAAYKRSYKNIIENKNFDKTECENKIFADNKTVSTTKAQVKDVELKIESLPAKISYKQGESLVLDGLTVSVIDNNGNKRILSANDYTLSSQIADNKILTITYSGITTTFNLEIEVSGVSSGCGGEVIYSFMNMSIVLLLVVSFTFVALKKSQSKKN